MSHSNEPSRRCRKALSIAVLAAAGLPALPAGAQRLTQPPDSPDYRFLDHARQVRYETAALLAGITLIGARSWNWGSSRSFRVDSEGWFGQETSSGGADKLGHAFSSYLVGNVLTDAMRFRGSSDRDAALTAGLITMGVMTYVEVLDAYSKDHGFSKEDLLMDLAGVGLSYLRNTTPGLREKLDFRLEYRSSPYKGFRPLSDYAGQRYLLALKLGGFDRLRRTPLRYVELHTGYYARGFTDPERQAGVRRERTGYVGIGINLGELIFGTASARRDRPYSLDYVGRTFFEHVQIPYTSYRALEHHDR